MKKHITLKDVNAAAEAAGLVAILVTIITIVGEVWLPLKDTLKLIFTHHWLGKSALSLALFVFIYWLRRNKPVRSNQVARSVYGAIVLSFIASFALVAFFVLHTMGIV
tara:strand:+ start:10164 stop:10487 length:324 start_codon:yes stop_codon:yes gene_type:complete